MFIPYKAGKPALVAVNGHRLIVLAPRQEALEGSEYLHADSIEELEVSQESLESALLDLNHDGSTGVVVTPDDLSADELIDTLSDQLPWVH